MKKHKQLEEQHLNTLLDALVTVLGVEYTYTFFLGVLSDPLMFIDYELESGITEQISYYRS